jgi:predicted transcriptional regulator
MKAVLISIKPKWCELIASGKKTVEVRKSKPKLETPFKVYIYMTMDKCPKFVYDEKLEKQSVFERAQNLANGRVIGEFVCDKIVQFKNSLYDDGLHETVARSCVPMYDLLVYIGKQSFGYGWHISNLVIYDEPKELSEFKKPNLPLGLRWEHEEINRPPQSWCYVEEQK